MFECVLQTNCRSHFDSREKERGREDKEDAGSKEVTTKKKSMSGRPRLENTFYKILRGSDWICK